LQPGSVGAKAWRRPTGKRPPDQRESYATSPGASGASRASVPLSVTPAK
jgi:hypothetical protein